MAAGCSPCRCLNNCCVSSCEKNSAFRSAVYAPPPYSCTRFRALNVSGIASWTSPPGDRLTRATRPRSAGRFSSQYRSSPANRGSAKPIRFAATDSAEIGDAQEPYGASFGRTSAGSLMGREVNTLVGTPMRREQGTARRANRAIYGIAFCVTLNFRGSTVLSTFRTTFCFAGRRNIFDVRSCGMRLPCGFPSPVCHPRRTTTFRLTTGTLKARHDKSRI